jgi:hypothetical protein
MNRLLAAVGAVIALSVCEILTLRNTSVSAGWTILAAAVSLILMVVAVSSPKRHAALVGALLVGAVPPALVVTEAANVPLRVVLPALFLLLAGELAAFSRDQISVVVDDGSGGVDRVREIGITIGMAGLAALAVGIIGRLDLGSGPVLIALGAMAIIAVILVLVPAESEPGTEPQPASTPSR